MSNQDPSQEGDYQIDIRKYREAEERAAAKAKEADDLRNQLALKDVEHAAQIAGIPTGTGAGKAFVASYTGPTDADSLKAAAIEYGIFKAEGSDATDTRTEQVQVEADRLLLQSGGQPPDVSAQPPARPLGEEAIAAFDADLRAGRSRDKAFSQVFDRVVDAAVKGNPEALVGDDWASEQMRNA